MATAATHVSPRQGSRKMQPAECSDRPLPSVVAKGCTTPKQYADTVTDCKVFVSSDSETLFVKDKSGCRNDDCKLVIEANVLAHHRMEILHQAVLELQKDKAELLLRGLTGDMERKACWLVLDHRKVEDFLWRQFSTFESLKNCEYLGNRDERNLAYLEARRMVALWWDPKEYSENMSAKDLDVALRLFYRLRQPGNGIAHPLFKPSKTEQLLRLAKVGRGENAASAWPIFFGWNRMQRDISNRLRHDSTSKLLDEEADSGELTDIETITHGMDLQKSEVDRYLDEEAQAEANGLKCFQPGAK